MATTVSRGFAPRRTVARWMSRNIPKTTAQHVVQELRVRDAQGLDGLPPQREMGPEIAREDLREERKRGKEQEEEGKLPLPFFVPEHPAGHRFTFGANILTALRA
jgi:hypothetical protein